MSDITLSTGIRQNLLSLQQTAADLTTTQEALATGKAVNSAADNPSAYFTSQNLTNDAHSLSSLLDQIGQGLQTINAATNGLQGITSLLQQALSTVQQAQSDPSRRRRPRPERSPSTGAQSPPPAICCSASGPRPPRSLYLGRDRERDRIRDQQRQHEHSADGAVTASDNGCGDSCCSPPRPISRLRNNATSDAGSASPLGTAVYRHQHHAHDAADELQRAAVADQSVRRRSGYNGVNLIGGNNLQINFNQTATSSLTIDGVNFNAAGLGLCRLSGSGAGSFFDSSELSSLVTNINTAHLERADPDRNLRYQLVDDLDPADVHDRDDQHPADRRQQLGGGGPEPGKRQSAHRADPAAAGNLGPFDRQPGEPVGAQTVRLKLLVQACLRRRGKMPRRFSILSAPALAYLRNDQAARGKFKRRRSRR